MADYLLGLFLISGSARKYSCREHVI